MCTYANIYHVCTHMCEHVHTHVHTHTHTHTHNTHTHTDTHTHARTHARTHNQPIFLDLLIAFATLFCIFGHILVCLREYIIPSGDKNCLSSSTSCSNVSRRVCVRVRCKPRMRSLLTRNNQLVSAVIPRMTY